VPPLVAVLAWAPRLVRPSGSAGGGDGDDGGSDSGLGDMAVQ
jgi:hypothetical protein